MQISQKSWQAYTAKLRKLSDKAADDLAVFINNGHDPFDSNQVKIVIDYAYALATKYGEGAGALAAEMYDALATLSGVSVPAAIPANTATYGEVARAVQGTMLQSSNTDYISSSIGRLVKLVGVDTMQQNALRDGAEWAWIPAGDTCSFCLTLASRGWQKASKKAIRGGHAEHVHSNCDCTYAIRLSDRIDVAGYDPDKYYQMYKDADGSTPNEKINAMRREAYAENSEQINEQKRAAYARRKEGQSNG